MRLLPQHMHRNPFAATAQYLINNRLPTIVARVLEVFKQQLFKIYSLGRVVSGHTADWSKNQSELPIEPLPAV